MSFEVEGEAFEGWGNSDVPIRTANFSFSTPELICDGSGTCEKEHRIGQTIAGGGDVDGDGVPDLLVGTGASGVFNGSDRAYLIRGSDLPLLSGVEFELDEASVSFGCRVAVGGALKVGVSMEMGWQKSFCLVPTGGWRRLRLVG